MSITPKNWNTFQHYKDRSPAWIKLHRGLLHDYAFSRLPVASRALAPMLWLLASEYEDGIITGDFEEAAYKLHMSKNEFCEAINPLIEGGFFTLDSVSLAARKQPASPEKRDIEKTEEEKNTSLRFGPEDWPADYREVFWAEYPKRVGRLGAMKALDAARKKFVPWVRLIGAVRAYAGTADPKFTKDPQTWLNKGCWDDELPKSGGGTPGTAATITPASRGWNAWKAHYRDTNQNFKAAQMDKSASDGKPWTVPSEWPPGHNMEAA